jgi:hypothetical protein
VGALPVGVADPLRRHPFLPCRDSLGDLGEVDSPSVVPQVLEYHAAPTVAQHPEHVVPGERGLSDRPLRSAPAGSAPSVTPGTSGSVPATVADPPLPVALPPTTAPSATAVVPSLSRATAVVVLDSSPACRSAPPRDILIRSIEVDTTFVRSTEKAVSSLRSPICAVSGFYPDAADPDERRLSRGGEASWAVRPRLTVSHAGSVHWTARNRRVGSSDTPSTVRRCRRRRRHRAV